MGAGTTEKNRTDIKPLLMLMFSTLAIGYFLIFIFRTTGGATSVIIQDHFGVDTSSVALLASAYLYAYILMQIPAGLLTDRFGPRKCISVFLVMIALSSLLSSFSAEIGNFDLMVLSRVIIGISAALVVIPASKLITIWVARDRFATVDGIFMFVGNLGSIVAAAPMVIMLESVGIVNTYLLLSAFTFLIAIVCWFVVRDGSGGVHRTDMSERVGAVESLRTILMSGGRFWFLAIWAFLLYSVSLLWSTSQAGLFYCSVYGYSTTDAGMLVSMYGVGMAISCAVSGILTDRVLRSTKKMLIIGSVLSTALWSVVLIMTCFEALDNLVVQGVMNFSLGMSFGTSTVMFTQIRKLYPLRIVGSSIALLNLFPLLGGATLIAISGFVVPNKSPEEYIVLWSIAFAILVVSTVLSFLTVEHKDDSTECPETYA